MKSWVWSLALILASTWAGSISSRLPQQVGTTPLPSLAPMLEKANPAVVNIATSATIETPLTRDPFFGFLIPGQRQRQANSLGSGVIIDADKGMILTNHHVIHGADEIQVTLEDGRELNAKVVGSDEETDVALLQVEANDLIAIPLGDSDALRVGDFVVAIGNPFSLGHSVTSGIVSAKGRSGLGIERFEDFIQTDAAINPGNSGGALVNLNGELIGINTAILGPKGNIGIGFAIPINLAKTITQHLVDYGEVRRGLIGIAVQELTPSLARALRVKDNIGVVVTEVSPDSSAAKAGIQTTDILLSVNGRKLKTPSDLLNQEGLLPAGSKITLEMIRDNKPLSIDLTLDEPKINFESGDDFHPLLTGVQLGEKQGVVSERAAIEVISIDRRSRAAYYGLQPGDKITGVGRYRVRSFDDLKQIMPSANRALPLRVTRDNEQFLIVIR
ncbi:DegQ family serine endoprotease [Pleionea sediminis]|uniref:DegQ family serine endoprotease n=1 Tax=Pleionea sediminis TaxID=2569479 RepID=UPI001184FAC7|nr:DegQ family serine endoprotease [Pleionea sediminis]